MKLLNHSQTLTVQQFSLALNTGRILKKILIGHLRRRCFWEGPLNRLRHCDVIQTHCDVILPIIPRTQNCDIMFFDLSYKTNTPEMNIWIYKA